MRSFIFVILIRYSCCYDDQIKKHEMGEPEGKRSLRNVGVCEDNIKIDLRKKGWRLWILMSCPSSLYGPTWG